ncbi:DUF1302 family protein [Pseudomonas abyssi]|uniref:LysR family transcriptional regulator n=1 Tax=Pseudomonas abyssi TaxID=170540 RepID=A0A395R1K4_9PSED|nr:DUF1302 family protein [Halopseudomonas gallaeciensis]RGP53642.1 LysR family transcriptional regulator [Halopseudomonas gallaeciensis]
MSAKKNNRNTEFARRSLLSAAVLMVTAGQSGMVSAQEGFLEGWEVHGYLRQYLSFNLEDPYLGDPATGGTTSKGDYKYDLSMARSVGKLNLYKDMGNSQLFISGRVAQEYETDYLEDLQEVMDQWAQTGGANKSGVDLMDDVYNEAEIREFWWQTDIRPSSTLKLGKQQVVWGETDFFQSFDVIHGYDFRWRSFLEPENEELRKPLWMVNFTERFDSVDGSLQLLYIPGRMNAADQRGNSYDVEGGRWANNPNKGLTFESAPFGANVPYNYDHKAADADDAAFGFRWSGLYGDWGYSLGWFRGPAQVPVINPNPAANGDGANGEQFLGAYKGDYQSDPAASVGELIFPQIDVFGVTANRYIEGIDAVFSTEVSYIPDNPYNVGVAAGEAGGCGFFPGFCGITEKDVVKTMFRLDKQVNLQSYIGTSRPSFFSVQLFDTWITNYDKSDGVVNLAGFSGETEEHSAIITGILAMNYSNDRINPTLAVGTDLTYGGGFVIPSVEYIYGDHWRFRAEADIFFDQKSQKNTLAGFNDTNLFGYFAGNDQLALRITYQF